MTKEYLTNYVKSQLGINWVDVELEDEDMDNMIGQALDKLAPYYEGKRYVQASGKVIDLSSHDPTAVTNIWNVKDATIMTAQEYAFGGSYVCLFDSSILNRFISYISYKMLYNELQHQKGMNYKFIYPNLYLDSYYDTVVIEITVRPKLVSDVEDTSMYASWLKEYVLALCKELLGRVRGKFNVEGSPYSLDSAQLISEAQQEKANLEQQLIGDIYVL